MNAQKPLAWIRGEVKTPPFSKKTGATPKSVLNNAKLRIKPNCTDRFRGRTMDKRKLKRLKAAGWQVGDASDFLELSDQEREFIEFKLALANKVKALRQERGMTQVEMARAIGSSQSRIAKLEAAEGSSVSTDLMLKSFFMLGATGKDIPVAAATTSTRRHKKTA